ncbi:MAG: site-specific integrase [Synergistaceae bacterium]|nr:site-specific integrase [Synergistaceae bacterium]
MSSKGKRFKTLTEEWVRVKTETVINVKQRDTLYKWLINYILPELGNKPYNVYNYKAMQNIFKKLKSTPETAKRVRGICAEIYMFGAKYDPICSAISRDVRSMEVVIEDQDKKRKFLASTNDIDLLRRIYKTAEESEKSQRNMCALQLLMLICARPKNVRFAQWKEFRLERKVWLTPSKRTDKQANHVIPLSSQAIDLLERIKKLNLAPEDCPYLFPAGDNNVLPDTAFASAMKIMGVGSDTQTAFGMRYSAEAIMKHEFRPEEITLKDVTVVVMTFLDAVTADGKPQYPPEIFMKQRAELAQWWADKLEGKI